MGDPSVQDKFEVADVPNTTLYNDQVTGIQLKGDLAPAVYQVGLRWIGGPSRVGQTERQEHQAA